MKDGSVREGQKLHDTGYTSASEAVVDWIQKNMLPVSACNKVFRLLVIKEFGIVFREAYSFGEDRLFNLDYLKHCGQVAISSQRDYVKSVQFAWSHLAEYYRTMTNEQRKQALEPYLDIHFPEKMERKTLRWPVDLWFIALKTAVRINSLPMLKLMMSITARTEG